MIKEQNISEEERHKDVKLEDKKRRCDEREKQQRTFFKKRSQSEFGLSVTSVNRVVYVQNETPTTLKDACCGAE